MELCKNACIDLRQQQVPSVPRSTGICCFILNIFFPGIGSILAGLQANSSSTVLIGVCQFFLAAVLIGWLWSVYWGLLIFNKSKYHEAVLLGISIYSQQQRRCSLDVQRLIGLTPSDRMFNGMQQPDARDMSQPRARDSACARARVTCTQEQAPRSSAEGQNTATSLNRARTARQSVESASEAQNAGGFITIVLLLPAARVLWKNFREPKDPKDFIDDFEVFCTHLDDQNTQRLEMHHTVQILEATNQEFENQHSLSEFIESTRIKTADKLILQKLDQSKFIVLDQERFDSIKNSEEFKNLEQFQYNPQDRQIKEFGEKNSETNPQIKIEFRNIQTKINNSIFNLEYLNQKDFQEDIQKDLSQFKYHCIDEEDQDSDVDSIQERWCEENQDSQALDDDDQNLAEENPVQDPLKDDTNLSAIQSLNSHHSDMDDNNQNRNTSKPEEKKKKDAIKEEEEGDIIKPRKCKKPEVKKISGISNKDMDDEENHSREPKIKKEKKHKIESEDEMNDVVDKPNKLSKISNEKEPKRGRPVKENKVKFKDDIEDYDKQDIEKNEKSRKRKRKDDEDYNDKMIDDQEQNKKDKRGRKNKIDQMSQAEFKELYYGQQEIESVNLKTRRAKPDVCRSEFTINKSQTQSKWPRSESTMVGCDNCDCWNYLECTGFVEKGDKGTKFTQKDFEELVQDIGDTWKVFQCVDCCYRHKVFQHKQTGENVSIDELEKFQIN